ncbi:hypothetical protein BT93_D0158 [Corymbia citriodora subsp. variegata]|nr:hypothetical protein BT93_D0158 [Corymbia citriodora subsp. variegata]
MSILSRTSSPNMGSPLFHEFKKQASFFLKEKIKTARLVLTDVTPAQLLTEDAINGNSWGSPDTRTLGRISKAAFEVDDYWRIVDILHDRLSRFDKKNWRISYNSLIVLEHLLTHGPESVGEEFQSDKDVIAQAGSFQYIDEKGFNWGLAVRKKSERILKFLEKGPLLKEERERARKLTRGIQGFGSFCQRTCSTQSILEDFSIKSYGRCNSHPENQENEAPEGELTKNAGASEQNTDDVRLFPGSATVTENSRGDDASLRSRTSFKENMEPSMEANAVQKHKWSCTKESRPLLDGKGDHFYNAVDAEGDHPFNHAEHECSDSLIHVGN